MFWLGHTGIGAQAARLVDREPPLAPLLAGTLLPDFLDKPLYYGLSWATGKRGADLGIIAGTRSFGHTVLLTAALFALGAARRSRALTALALGMATHLVMDVFTDACVRGPGFSAKAFAWPLLGWQFPVYPFYGWRDHVVSGRNPFILITESVGAALLVYEWRRRRRA
ncbi:MAG: metal-dependent hydrolase [Elusimicrobia bacterium]|nr:metal-dependent hydrolase [Elusimicrobiota bacterium]